MAPPPVTTPAVAFTLREAKTKKTKLIIQSLDENGHGERWIEKIMVCNVLKLPKPLNVNSNK